MRLRGAAVAALVLALTLAGCAPRPPSGAPPGASPGPPSTGVVAAPGLYQLEDGSTQALGILAYRDVEGGFWAVVDTAIPEEADSAPILAVVLPDAIEVGGKMAGYEGKYVNVVGKRDDGPTIYQSGPVIDAASIEVVSDTQVE